ncbi:MAG: Ribosomal RNA large subunit methyltransferase I [Firmicutes bacterium]|nr:Ribosomal RNA large subunit methyltransferase I [Bacillota bacterium]
MYPTVYLQKERRPRIMAGHPWIFQSDIGRIAGTPLAGGLVRVQNHAGAFVGVGYYNPDSQIAVRLLTRQDEEITPQFFQRRIGEALSLRQRVVDKDTTAYRLVHSEADYLPGLIVDIYGQYAVMQVLTLGLEPYTEIIAECLRDTLGIKGLVLRNDVSVRRLEGLDLGVSFLGDSFSPHVEVKENGLRFEVDLWSGQKTGYFLDQRENRAFIRPFVQGMRVLDCFSHTGSFAVHAAHFGASEVTAVDIAATAVEGTLKNAALNNLPNISAVMANAFDFLREQVDARERYGAVLIDPPAFTKSKASLPAARRGYKEVNLRGMKLVSPGGYLVTSSCSYHLSREDFLAILNEAAADAHRQVKVVAIRGQAMDHPLLLAARETSYLKFVVLQVW